jgi:hypothetical protein
VYTKLDRSTPIPERRVARPGKLRSDNQPKAPRALPEEVRKEGRPPVIEAIAFGPVGNGRSFRSNQDSTFMAPPQWRRSVSTSMHSG